mmetsp:Transcript_11953/g.28146  ORF Transcript_11953/g.28146 Transcript_11953/m.28146 type:complete len:122 (+) Transcript_11953:115-480(+)
MQALLQRRAVPPPLPKDVSDFTGTYGPDAQLLHVSLDASRTELKAELMGQSATLLPLVDRSSGNAVTVDAVYRVVLDGQQDTSCRWLDDGGDNELMYFYRTSPGQPATKVVYMQATYGRRS